MKGIIADIKGNQAVLLTKNNEYLKIKNKDYSVGEEIIYPHNSYTKFATLAACFLFCVLTGLGGVKIYFTPVNYIDIDINPSIRIGSNIFDRVVEVVPLNGDGEKLIDTLGITNGEITEYIGTLVKTSEDLGYINSNNYDIEIEVVSDSDGFYSKTEKYCKNIETNKNNMEISINRADEESFTRAKKLGISIGKLKLLDKYKSVNTNISEDDLELLKYKNASEIKQMIEMVKETTDSWEKVKERTEQNTQNPTEENTNSTEREEKNAAKATEKAEKEAANATKKAEKEVKRDDENQAEINQKETEENASSAEREEKNAAKATEKAEKEAANATQKAEKEVKRDDENQAEINQKEIEENASSAERAEKDAAKATEKAEKEAANATKKAEKEVKRDDENQTEIN